MRELLHRRLLLEAVLFVAALEAVILVPNVAMTVLIGVAPLIVAGSVVATLYLRRIYLRQPTPRSRFFGMVVGISGRIAAASLWLVYLTIARIGDRTGWYAIPSPPPEISSPLTALVILGLATPPIFYAVTVYRVRRAASRRRARGWRADEAELDRE